MSRFLDPKGAQFIVEVQINYHKGCEKRAQFYAANAYSRQVLKDDEQHRKLTVYAKLKEVIFLAIADFIMFPEKKLWKSEHRVLDTTTYENDLKDFHFVFIELPKFKKSLDELTNIQEKWAYFFKHAHQSTLVEMEHLIGNDIVIKRAFQAIDQASWSEEELNTYDKIVKIRLDKLPDLYKHLLIQKDILIADGLSEIEIIDLGEIVISHPFFSLVNCLRQVTKHYGLTEKDDTYLQIRDACLKNYLNFTSKKHLLDAFATARILWIVYEILSHHRLMLACGKEKIMAFQPGRLSNSLKEFLGSLLT